MLSDNYGQESDNTKCRKIQNKKTLKMSISSLKLLKQIKKLIFKLKILQIN